MGEDMLAEEPYRCLVVRQHTSMPPHIRRICPREMRCRRWECSDLDSVPDTTRVMIRQLVLKLILVLYTWALWAPVQTAM